MNNFRRVRVTEKNGSRCVREREKAAFGISNMYRIGTGNFVPFVA